MTTPTAAFIERFEGCKLVAYPDIVGVWTCGWGHTGSDVWPGLIWTQAEADMHLTLDIQDAEHALLRYSPALYLMGTVTALVSFIFNLGIAAYRTSTLCKFVNAGNWGMAKLEIVKWDHAGGREIPGLLARRQAEAQLLGT